MSEAVQLRGLARTTHYGAVRAFTLILLGLAMASRASSLPPEAVVTVRVTDENGVPIKDAQAGASAMLSTEAHQFQTKIESRCAVTDANGEARFGVPTAGTIAYGATKDGWYRTLGLGYGFTKLESGRWEPWNPVLDVQLKKIKNPIPMYARIVDARLPKLEESIGFDMVEGDWVAPFGKGTESDLVFSLKKRIVDWRDFDAALAISFSHDGDGLIPFERDRQKGSVLMSGHEAPILGYLAEWIMRQSYSEVAGTRDISGAQNPDRHYYLRIRTNKKEGRIESAMYGKIYSDFEYNPFVSSTCRICFVYYLNPDGTTNVEFDPKRNLFKDGNEASIWQP